MRRVVQIPLLAFLLFSACQPAAAQKKKEAAPDTVRVAFFHGIAVHAEAVGALQLWYGDHGQYEAGLRINLKDRYFPAFEMGYGKADETENYVEESWCRVKAPYFRVGCDFNILRDKHDAYKLFVGFRYAYSDFKYDMTVAEEVEDGSVVTTVDEETGEETETPGTVTEYREHDGLKARYHWLEGVIGVDAKVFGPLHLGWDVRYRRVLAKSYDSTGAPWYIPGFGDRKKAGFTLAFNVTISF